MSEFAEKPAEQRQMIERSSTLQDLFDCERRGQKAEFRSDATSELSNRFTVAFETAWKSNFGALKDSLNHQMTADQSMPPQKRAQMEVMAQELDDLNGMQPGERIAMLKAFKDNTTTMGQAQSAADKVQQAMRAGYMPAALDSQRDVVKLVSGLNQKATASVINSTEKVLAREKDPAVKAALENSLEDARAVAAAPFVEKARMGAFLLNDNKVYQAEKMLTEAVNTSVIGEGWKLQANRDLRQDVKDQLSVLHVQNNLTELFDANVDKLDPTKSKHVTMEELNSQKGKGDDNFQALTRFLSDNYKYLTRHHWPVVSRDGVSTDDIKDYVQERNKTVNDLKVQ